MNDNSEPAFPNESGQYFGMSLRDYFAAKALNGMMATRKQEHPKFSPEDDAEFCYRIADAMLKERAK